MTECVVREELGELLSPSQVNTYLTCPAKWHFHYLLGLTEEPTGAPALGKAFHAALATNFSRKLTCGREMEPAEAREAFEQEWIVASHDAQLRDDEDTAELTATGEALVDAYISEAARNIEPRSVEQPIEGTVANVKVRGVVDVLDINGCVIDFKTAAKRPKGIPAEHRLQLTTYAMVTPGASGSCRLDTVTKTKTVLVIQQTYDVGAEEHRFAEALYPMVQDSIRDGVCPPHRGSSLCSRRALRILAGV